MIYKTFKGKNLLTILLSIILFQTSLAQDYTDNWKFLRKGEILSNEGVTGYFEFYRVLGLADNCTDYALRIFNSQLQIETEKKLNICGGYILNQATKIGDNFLFKFIAKNDKSALFMLCDDRGNVINEVRKDVDLTSDYYMDRRSESLGDVAKPSLHNMDENHIVDITSKWIKKPFKSEYEISAFNEQGKNLWTYLPDSTGDANRRVEYIGNGNNQAVIQQTAYKKVVSTKARVSIIAIDTNGNSAFKFNMNSSERNCMAKSCTYSSNGTWEIHGYYFKGNGKMLRDSPLGLFYLELNSQGEKISEKLTPWSSILDESSLENDYKPYIQEFLKIDSNNYLMILENIKVTTTSNSLDAKVIDKKIGFVSGGEYQKGSAWMEYDDLTLVLLSAKGEVITTKTIDKVRKRFALPNGWGISNGNILIYHLAEQKYFDYQLTQSSLDDSKIFIYYNDLDKEKNTKKILILDTNLNEITTDEISENPKANISTRAFPGSKGYIRVEVKDLKIRDQIKNFKNQTIEPINY